MPNKNQMIEPNWLSDDPPDSKLLPVVTRAREILSGWSEKRVKETDPFVYDFFTKKFESDLVEMMSPLAVSFSQFGKSRLNFLELTSIFILKEAFDGKTFVAIRGGELLSKFQTIEMKDGLAIQELHKLYKKAWLPHVLNSEKEIKDKKNAGQERGRQMKRKANEDSEKILSEATRLLDKGSQSTNIASKIAKKYGYSKTKVYRALKEHPSGHWPKKKK